MITKEGMREWLDKGGWTEERGRYYLATGDTSSCPVACYLKDTTGETYCVSFVRASRKDGRGTHFDFISLPDFAISLVSFITNHPKEYSVERLRRFVV